MCGIYGKIRFDGRPADRGDSERACDLLAHRGPDDRGTFVSGEACLGHTRLSIIDLSPQGRQPMCNEDGSLWIVFNGEIYNFFNLRTELEAKGHRFRSRTDTEVVLHLFEEKKEACVESLRGMFAFAIWDQTGKTLFLARDRVGKKPLFYYPGRNFFSFCSELAPLVSDPEIPVEVEPESIHHYLTFQSVPAPLTAYRSLRKLLPGHWGRISEGRFETRRFWKLSFREKYPADTSFRRAYLEERLLEKLEEAVRVRLESDVPLGALLSGGVDSSGVVALMSRAGSARAVRTFSVGFAEQEYNELRYAQEVSRRFGTEHTELTVKPDMLGILPLLVEHFGEPFSDSAAIPVYYITNAAREHVTVALCGDGGDESFAGYYRYKLLSLLGRFDWMPEFFSRTVFRLLRAIPHSPNVNNPLWIAKRFFQTLSLPPEIRNLRFYGHFNGELKSSLYTEGFARFVAGIDSEELVLRHYRETDADNLLDATLYADIHTYLSDTLLPKVDITSMANSLEMRSPYLDHELMEFAARLPANLKMKGLATKHILKKALRTLLPEQVINRPKMGFGVPLDHWFRGELKDMVRETLLSSRALGRGYFRQETIQKILDEQERNRWNWHHHIYNLLMLEMWHRRFIDR